MTNPVNLAEPLDIGGVHIRNRVFLAPMSGVTDRAVPPARPCAWRRPRRFRNGGQRRTGEGHAKHPADAYAIQGCPSIWCSSPAAKPRTWLKARASPRARAPTSSTSTWVVPAKKVTGGYSGSALMRDLDHALTLIDAVVAAVDVPVTLKMRLGWDDATLNAPMLARRAEQAGVKMVTVHGRTRCQFYQGKADWRAIARVKAAVSIPVVANGDVGSACGCREDSGAFRRGCRDGRPRRITARRGPPATSPMRRRAQAGRNCPGQRRRDRRLCRRRTTRTCCPFYGVEAACGRRASISAGISTAMRRVRQRTCVLAS